jgi:hypothetical protein
MKWKLSKDDSAGSTVWTRELDGASLSVSRSENGNYPWRWHVRYGIVTVFGYSKTLRSAKMRSTRVARQYILQGNLWGYQ